MAIQDIVFRDFWWKLLAFVLATLIWANFGGKLNDRIELDVSHFPTLAGGSEPTTRVLSKPLTRPVALVRPADSTELLRIEPVMVSIVIRGEASFLRALDSKQILAFVDVTDMNERHGWAVTTRRTSRVVQVSYPPGVELISVLPKSVIVERVAAPETPATDLKHK
jgi:hypothetical protein